MLPCPVRWPAFRLPKEDELLSSWLLRNSHAHHLKAHTFCKAVWPTLAFWNRDIDRLALPEVWHLLARQVGVSMERSYQTTLAAYEGRLFKRAISHGNCPWILALGIYHRTHTHFGIQYCPSCLRRDGIQPYYRRWWRLALAIGCPHCGCHLLDECPFCEQPVIFHRSEIGRKNELAAYSLSHCTSCYTNLADLQTTKLTPELLAQQQAWYSRINDWGGGPDGHDYFDVVRQLMMLLNSKKVSLRLFQQAVAEGTGFDYQQPAGGYPNRLETLRLAPRLQLVTQITWLLTEWPARLSTLIQQTGTRLSSVLAEPQNLPPAFVHLLQTLQIQGRV